PLYSRIRLSHGISRAISIGGTCLRIPRDLLARQRERGRLAGSIGRASDERQLSPRRASRLRRPELAPLAFPVFRSTARIPLERRQGGALSSAGRGAQSNRRILLRTRR